MGVGTTLWYKSLFFAGKVKKLEHYPRTGSFRDLQERFGDSKGFQWTFPDFPALIVLFDVSNHGYEVSDLESDQASLLPQAALSAAGIPR